MGATQGGEQLEDNDKEKEKKKKGEEESLRMTSWVDVSNERLSGEDNSEEEATPKPEEVKEELMEAEGRSREEAEKQQTSSVEAELAVMEEKWREQCAINETLKQRLANEEERFRVRNLSTPGYVM